MTLLRSPIHISAAANAEAYTTWRGLEYDHGLDEEAARCSGHEVERHEVVFSGICAHCVEKH